MSPAASAAFSGSMTRVKAVSVTRMPTRSLVRISCAVTSSGVGRVSILVTLTVRPTAQKACEAAIAGQERPLVVLHDDLELAKQHDTYSSGSSCLPLPAGGERVGLRGSGRLQRRRARLPLTLALSPCLKR